MSADAVTPETAYLSAQARRRHERERRRKSRRATATVTTREIQNTSAIPTGRLDPPVVWPGVAAFSKYTDEELTTARVVDMLKRSGLIDGLLEIEKGLRKPGGRTPIRGSWVLAYFGFANSGDPNIQSWLRNSDAEMWWAAGFEKKPRYHTVRLRFIELEERCLEDFFEATIPVLRLVQERSGGLVSRDCALDAAEADAHVRLHHACKKGECPGWSHNRLRDRHGAPRDSKARKAARTEAGQQGADRIAAEEATHRALAKEQTKDGVADDDTPEADADRPDEERNPVLPRLSTEEASAQRRRNADLPLDDDGFAPDHDYGIEKYEWDEETQTLRVKAGPHWFELRDSTAGVRKHEGPRGAIKAWVGYINSKLISHAFGAAWINLVESADENEASLFEEILGRAERIFGREAIRIISADKAFASKPPHMLAAEHGITLITPYRRSKNNPDGIPLDTDLYDRDIPRCRTCGGEAEFLRFNVWSTDTTKAGQREYEKAKRDAEARGEDPDLVEPPRKLQPRLWYTCKSRRRTCCDANGKPKQQSILVSTEPRQLKPLWPDTAPYQVMREMGLSNERPHHYERRRYANGGKDISSRPCRIGRDWQQMRAYASITLNYTKIAWMQGMLDLPGCYARNVELPYQQIGDDLVEQMQAERRVEGLKRPYGKNARKNLNPKAPLRPFRAKRAVNADTGEVLGEAMSPEEIEELLGSVDRADRRLVIIEDDPGAGELPATAPARTGEHCSCDGPERNCAVCRSQSSS